MITSPPTKVKLQSVSDSHLCSLWAVDNNGKQKRIRNSVCIVVIAMMCVVLKFLPIPSQYYIIFKLTAANQPIFCFIVKGQLHYQYLHSTILPSHWQLPIDQSFASLSNNKYITEFEHLNGNALWQHASKRLQCSFQMVETDILNRITASSHMVELLHIIPLERLNLLAIILSSNF